MALPVLLVLEEAAGSGLGVVSPGNCLHDVKAGPDHMVRPKLAHGVCQRKRLCICEVRHVLSPSIYGLRSRIRGLRSPPRLASSVERCKSRWRRCLRLGPIARTPADQSHVSLIKATFARWAMHGPSNTYCSQS